MQLLRTLGILIATAVLSGATLPEQGPLPAARPEEKSATQDDATQDADDKSQPAGEKPSQTETEPEKEAVEAIIPVEKEDPAAYAACLADLKALGATFRESKPVEDGKGCGMDKPIVLQSVGAGVALEPEGEMRCQTALKLAQWTQKTVMPAAETALGDKGRLVGIGQASAYVCRLRNNAETGKISEHARGNAVDIATFRFKDGPTIEMKPRVEDSTMIGAFQRAVTAAACLYFSTVLSPGSDAAHETHLHLDVLERRGDYRFCR